METKELDAPDNLEGFNARLRGIESIIEKAMQKNNNNLTLNFFLSPVGQHVERTDSAHVWMRKDDEMEYRCNGDDNKEIQNVGASHLRQAAAECQKKGYIWGNAAYAILFCVCRDVFSIENNATSFERLLAEGGIVIPEGTINAAFSRNPWLKYHTDKWKDINVPKRALRLRDAVIEIIYDITQQKIWPLKFQNP